MLLTFHQEVYPSLDLKKTERSLRSPRNLMPFPTLHCIEGTVSPERNSPKVDSASLSTSSSLPFFGYYVSIPLELIRKEIIQATPIVFEKLSRISTYLKENNLCKTTVPVSNKYKTDDRFLYSPEGQCVIAINAGFWGKDKKPLDWLVLNRRIIKPLTNINRPILAFSKNALEIIDLKEKALEYGIYEEKDLPSLPLLDKIQSQFLEEFSYISILQAGPLLIKEGTLNKDYSDYIEKAYEFNSDITAHRHPRSFLAYNDKTLLVGFIQGRCKKSVGLYLEELAELLLRLGMKQAINLDGGASSTLYYNCIRFSEARVTLCKKFHSLSFPIPKKERKIKSFLLFKTS